MTRMPANPHRTPIQLSIETRSPRRAPESATTRRGDAKPIAVKSARGISVNPTITAALASNGRTPRAACTATRSHLSRFGHLRGRVIASTTGTEGVACPDDLNHGIVDGENLSEAVHDPEQRD